MSIAAWIERFPNLERYVTVHGNWSQCQYYLAVKFKFELLVYESNLTHVISIPPGRAVLIDHRPDLQLDDAKSLVFLRRKYGSHASVSVNNAPEQSVRETTVASLLRCLFPPDAVTFFVYTKDTLFAASDVNPFERFWTRVRRNVSFRSLEHILSRPYFQQVESCGRDVGFDEVLMFRHFAKGDSVDSFRGWWPMVFKAARKGCHRLLGQSPDPELGYKLEKVLERHRTSPQHSGVSRDFYTCQLSLDDSCPVGVQFTYEYDRPIKYVSPMIVSKTCNRFFDVNHVVCSDWLPLYKDKKNWNEYGFQFYMSNAKVYEKVLKLVMNWLSFQTSTVYLQMHRDLEIVRYVLMGPADGSRAPC